MIFIVLCTMFKVWGFILLFRISCRWWLHVDYLFSVFICFSGYGLRHLLSFYSCRLFFSGLLVGVFSFRRFLLPGFCIITSVSAVGILIFIFSSYSCRCFWENSGLFPVPSGPWPTHFSSSPTSWYHFPKL